MLQSLLFAGASYNDTLNQVKLSQRASRMGSNQFLAATRARNSRSGPRVSIHETNDYKLQVLQSVEASKRRQTPSRDRIFKSINREKLETDSTLNTVSHKKATSEEKRFELPGLRKLSDSPCSKSAGSFNHKVFHLPVPDFNCQPRCNKIISSPRDLSPGNRVRYSIREPATSTYKRNVSCFKSNRNSTGSHIPTVPSDTIVRSRKDSRLRSSNHNRIINPKEADLDFKKLKARLSKIYSKQFPDNMQNQIDGNENLMLEDSVDQLKTQPSSILKPNLNKRISEQTTEPSFDYSSQTNTPTQQLKLDSAQENVPYTENTSKSPERYTTNHEALILKVRSKPKVKIERKSGPARYLPADEIGSVTSLLKDMSFKQPSSLASDLKLLQEINGPKTKRIIELDKFSTQVYNEIKPKISSILKKKVRQDIPELMEWSSPESSPVAKTVQFKV